MDHLGFDPMKNGEPLVLRKSRLIDHWSCFRWTSQDWVTNLESFKLSFRLHRKANDGIPWENETDGRVDATIDQYLAWRKKSKSLEDDNNPFCSFDSDLFWAYSSYNHLTKLRITKLIDSINWSTIGFGCNLGDNGESSVFWVGSKDAATPCHYDTYGYNLVSQITGRKLWVLFPPEDTDKLYPTRIPFEESSVFSEVNIESPSYEIHPKMKDVSPFVVTLEPGDVLYVPYHWWHYVKCLDDGPDGFCVSINQWLPMSNSNFDLLTEGFTNLLVTSLFPFYQPSNEDWLVDQNAEETLIHPANIIDLINQITTSTTASIVTNKINRWIDCVPDECTKLDKIDCEQLKKCFPPVTIDENGEWIEQSTKRPKMSKDISRKDIINSILKPDIVQAIVKNLMDRVNEDVQR